MNDLVPEQRSDKNGNIVTRWVRSMFATKEPSRSIPAVTIDVSPHPTSRSEAKEIYNRLMATMPEGKSVEVLPDIGDDELQQKLADRRVLKSSFTLHQYHLLPLFEAYGDTHSYETIRNAVGNLHAGGHKAELTDEMLTAYESMRRTIREAIVKSQEEEGVFLPEVFISTVDLPKHVLVHPEDGPILEGIIRQGVANKDKIFEMLSEIKAGRLARSISDGFL